MGRIESTKLQFAPDLGEQTQIEVSRYLICLP